MPLAWKLRLAMEFGGQSCNFSSRREGSHVIDVITTQQICDKYIDYADWRFFYHFRIMCHRKIQILALACLVWCVQSYNILLPVADIPSHVIFFGRMAEILRARGHDVTLFLPSRLKVPSNIRQMDFNTITYHSPGPSTMLREDFKAISHEMAFNPSVSSKLKLIDLVSSITKDMAKDLFKDKNAFESVEAGDFDFVIVDHAMMAYFLIPYKLGKPYAYLGVDCMASLRRIPIMPSYVPGVMTSYTDNMNFVERTMNFLFHLGFTFYDFGGYEESRAFVPERPVVGYNEFFLNASLCLLVRDNVIDFIKPLMPDVIPVANLMAREAKPLPADLQSYMNQSTNGVVLVSFGTMVAEVPPEVIDKMLKAFQNLDHNVIFRYPSPADLTNVPPNVRVMSWMPQNDLLADSNMKLFITHCGMSSIVETFYHGVPVIGFPHNIDQFSNAALAKSKGIGEVLAIHDFTSEELQTFINSVISDQKYRSAAKKLSTVFKDTLVHAPRDPVYWIEHVIKFGDHHLRSRAREMPMYQYLMIDVIAFLVVSALVLTTISLIACRCVITRLCCHRRKDKVEWFCNLRTTNMKRKCEWHRPVNVNMLIECSDRSFIIPETIIHIVVSDYMYMLVQKFVFHNWKNVVLWNGVTKKPSTSKTCEILTRNKVLFTTECLLFLFSD